MSDAEHDRIARLLREQGQAEAPPDLAADLMAQVRREPQAAAARRGVNWRPVAGIAAAAAVLLAIGFGIASLSGGGMSSSSSGAAMEAAAGGGSSATPPRAATDGAVAGAFTVERHDAQKILRAARAKPFALTNGSVVTLNRAQWDAVRNALAGAAARNPNPEDPVVVQLRRN